MGEEFPIKFLIDGIDRLGKSSLIERIQQELGYHLVIHYDKPKVLAHYVDMADCIKRAEVSETDFDESYRNMDIQNLARRLYQEDANRGMFELIKNDTPMIFDRTHLGEMVYAPLYRKYSGEYVFDMEKDMLLYRPYSKDSAIRLILLTTSNFEMIQDDGLSFDFNKKEDEQKMFIDAFNKSNITNKVIVDVHNGHGGYKSFEEVFNEAIYSPYKNSSPEYVE